MNLSHAGRHMRVRRASPRVLLASILVACSQPAATTPIASPGFRVLVYNVHAGKDAAGKESVRRIADVVRETGADVVLLQEVDKGTKRSGGVDQPAEYARYTGYHVAFGRSLDYDGGEYGIAILSRWPIRRDTAVHLPVDPPQERSGGSHEPRIAMSATVAAPFGDLVLVNTHIDASNEDRWRLQEIRTIERIVKETLATSDARVLAGGDFNSTPESAVQIQLRSNGFRDAWPTCGTGEGLSYPTDVPRKRIDYLFLLRGFECIAARVVDADASDHRPVLFTLRPLPRTR